MTGGGSRALSGTPGRSILYTPWDNAAEWLAALRAALPDRPIDLWEGSGGAPPGPAQAADYDLAFVWQAPEALFEACRGLRVVCSLGAGSDHILRHRAKLPAGTAVLRAADPLMADRMADYVLAAVLAFTQNHDLYRRQQAARVWQRHAPRDATATPVGLLGLGRLGRRTAEKLQAAGFPVTAWVRSQRAAAADSAVPLVSGEAALADLLGRVRVLVVLLPETGATRGLIARPLLDRLPHGSLLVNPGRGGLMVEADVLSALDSGRLAAAALDVFETEPLPPDNPLWAHPAVTLTPHSAAISDPVSVTQALAADLARLAGGDRPDGWVDMAAGY